MPALVCPLGPNPAPLTEALWALARDGGRVPEAWAVCESGEAEAFLAAELRLPGGPLDQLRERFPGRLGGLRLHVVVAPGRATGDLARALFGVVAEAKRRHDAVVLTLSGGRWRGSAAAATLVFQVLGGLEDQLVDVRVDTPAAEGGSGFFFPEQARQDLVGRAGPPFRARDVRVLLEPVTVPRLRPLLRPADLHGFDAALQAGVEAVSDLSPPRLRLDLHAGRAWVGETPLGIPPPYLPYAAWVWVRHAQEGQPARAGDLDDLRAFLRAWAKAGGGAGALAPRRRGSLAAKVLDGDPQALVWADVSPQVSRGRARIAAALQAVHPRGGLLAPRERPAAEPSALGTVRCTWHGVDVPPDHIVLEGRITALDWG